METLQGILGLLGVVVLAWLGTAAMFRLAGGPIPWPYPRHWPWGSATLEAAYAIPNDPPRALPPVVAAPLERQLVRLDSLDHHLRRN